MSRIKKLLFALVLVVSLASLPLWAVSTLTSFVVDTFTRADAATLGVGWGTYNNLGGCRISSNQAKPTVTTATGGCLYSALDWPNDQAAQATLATIAAIGTDLAGVLVRGQFSQNTQNGYYAGSYNTADTKIHLVRIVNNGFTNLATSAANVVLSDVINLQATGCNPVSLIVLQNGTAVPNMNPVSDAAATAPCAGSPGILVFSPTNIANAGLTNWTGYAITNPATVNNSAPFPQLALGAQTNLGNLTGASQALQFTLPARSELFIGRLQVTVGSTTGTVVSPAWVLECSQDTGTTWFQLPASLVPTAATQLSDIFPIYGSFYDVSGLGGASCKFGLGAATGTVTGTLPVWAMVG